MSNLASMLLCLALALDPFALSIADGMSFDRVNIKRAAIIAVTFGVFQMIMLFAGFFLGNFIIAKFLLEKIERIDRWLVLVLLCFLGIKMIVQGIAEVASKRAAKAVSEVAPDTFKEKLNEKMTVRLILVQGIATSVDTLAAGVSLAVAKVNIFNFAIMAGCFTTLISFPAVFLGKKTGDFFIEKAEFLSGIILIALAVKLFFNYSA